jgi:hypothetical protein
MLTTKNEGKLGKLKILVFCCLKYSTFYCFQASFPEKKYNKFKRLINPISLAHIFHRINFAKCGQFPLILLCFNHFRWPPNKNVRVFNLFHTWYETQTYFGKSRNEKKIQEREETKGKGKKRRGNFLIINRAELDGISVAT